MRDGRGLHMKKISDKTNEAVKKYMLRHPEALRVDACRDLKITAPTLRKHLKRIENENTPGKVSK